MARKDLIVHWEITVRYGAVPDLVIAFALAAELLPRRKLENASAKRIWYNLEPHWQPSTE
jgi:hypothetical protein